MLEFILIVVGLFICFGGIYLKKIVAGLTGLSWGAGLGVLLGFLISIQQDIDTTGIIVIAVIIAIIVAALAVKFDRFCACINSLFSSLSLFFVIALMATKGESLGTAIGISVVLALITAGISIRFYDYSFIISTALTGGIIASLGAAPLFNGKSLDSFIGSVVWSGSGIGQVTSIAVVLAIAGIIVQLRRLNKNLKTNEVQNAADE